MKHILPLAAALVLTATSASAQALFDPDFSSGSAPAGYTPTTANGGMISYANNQMTTGDDSVNGTAAYITKTISNPSAVTYPNNSSSFNTQFTFTPTYHVSGTEESSAAQAQIYLFSVTTPNANNPILQVSLYLPGFGDNYAAVQIDSGVQFGTSNVKSGNSAYIQTGVNSLNGTTLTLDLTTTITATSTSATITNVGTLSDFRGTPLYSYDLTVSGPTVNDDYDPAHNGLTFNLGTVGVSANTGFIDSGASTTLSNVLVQAVPEPSTYALMIGGGGLLLLAVRRRLGLAGGRA